MYAGFDKVFQLAKDFREGDSNYKSNPEFTQLSIAARGINYEQMVGVFREYISSIATTVNHSPIISFFGSQINLETDWTEITVKDALAKFCDVDLDKNLENSDLEKTMEKLQVPGPAEARKYEGVIKYNIMMEEVLDKFIMPQYNGKILFLKEYPYSLGAPGKAVDDKPQYKQRGEVFVNGIEIINGSTIPTDSDVIKKWYDHALRVQLDSGLWPRKRLDEDYLESTRLGIPHMSAMTLGYDRFIMMLTNSKNINEVITFPVQLRSN
jgi:lysyl-tRNA synthetase class 2